MKVNEFLRKAILTAALFSLAPCLAQELPPEPVEEESEIPGQYKDESLEEKQKSLELIDLADPSQKQDSKPPVETKSVGEGPLKNERQTLYDQIQQAGQSGVGIKNYMMAFDYIEQLAAKGASEEEIKKRMVPLITALSNQFKRKEELKSRPSPSQMDQIMKNKNIDKSQIPKGVDESFLKNKLKDPRIQEMIKKYQNR